MKSTTEIKEKLFTIIILLFSVLFTSGTLLAEELNLTNSSLNEPPVTINFLQPGAVYHKNEPAQSNIRLNLPNLHKVDVEIVDIDDKRVVKSKTFNRQNSDFVFTYPFILKELGYFYIKVSYEDPSDNKIKHFKQGFGVIPQIALTEKDWDSPFGVCGHYQRYNDWRIGDIQNKLGIAWVRDEAEWQRIISGDFESDPYIDYLDSKNICWLALIDYVDSYNGVQNADSIWRWDEDVAMIKEYVEMHKGKLPVYESQNEPNNFGGWSKRWPHPQGEEWKPQGWGKPFADLIMQMQDAISDVDQSIKVIWQADHEWVDYFVKEKDAASYIDITSLHPYVNWDIIPESDNLAAGGYVGYKKNLEKLNVSQEVWVTELGWSTFISDGNPHHYQPVTEIEQAAYLVRSYLMHLYHGASKVFWYEMVDEPLGENDPESFFGLVRYNKSLSVKPSAVAYSNLINNYRYAVPIGKYNGSYGVLGFSYKQKNGKPQLNMWRKRDSSSEVLKLDRTKQIEVIDIFGRSQKVKVKKGEVKIQVGISPVTIVGIHESDFESLYTPM